MSSMRSYPARLSFTRLVWAALILAIPAFLIELDRMPFIGDEGIRSLVALEMKLSGNYIVPTLHGDVYLNKPPLYNWFIVVVSGLAGHFGEWPTRLTNLFFLAAYAWSVYRVSRQQFGLDKPAAWLQAFMLLTCGRILFWDSMVGLIDICFSWVIYLNFTSLYYFGRKQQWASFFLVSYLLTAAAFLLKGLPAVVFQAISIPVALLVLGAFRRRFFSLRHVLGALAGLLPVLLYYAAFTREQSLDLAFRILLDQSVQRTAARHGFEAAFMHLFTFPFEQIYHFLPWSLLIVVVFHPKFWRWTRQHPYVQFSFWMLVANLPVYWSSVEVYPRYLLMFVPLFNAVCYWTWQQAAAERHWTARFSVLLLQIMATGAAVLWWAAPLHPEVQKIPDMVLRWLPSALLLTLTVVCLLLDRGRTLIWLVLALFAIRIGFDLIVLPSRAAGVSSRFTPGNTQQLAARWSDRPWRVYRDSETNDVARFYITNALQQIVRRSPNGPAGDTLVIIDTNRYPEISGRIVDSLILEGGNRLSVMEAAH